MHSLGSGSIRVLTVTACLTAALSPAIGGNGDIDGNGSVTTPDVILALRFVGGLQTPTGAQASAADAVLGGGVNLRDAVRIGRIASGKDPFDSGSGSAALPTSGTVTVAATGTTTKDFTLPGGFRVSGTVNLTDPSAFGYVALKNTGSQTVYGPAVVSGFLTKSFTFTVPAGTYQLLYSAVEDDSTDNGDPVMRLSATNVGATFSVNANVTGKNFDPPAPPVTTGVKIAYAGAGITNLAPDALILSDGNVGNAFGGLGTGKYANVSLLELTADTVPLSAGTYYALLLGRQNTALGVFVDFSFYPATPFTAPTATTKTITVPAVRELNGTLTDPAGGGGSPTGVRIAPQVTAGDYATSGAEVNFPYSYALVAPPGSYYLSIEVTRTGTTDTIDFAVPATIPATGAAVKDVNLPALPAFHTLTGIVKGPDGKVLPNASVAVSLAPGYTVPAAGRYVYFASGATDAAGRYSLLVPADNYTVYVAPPQ